MATVNIGVPQGSVLGPVLFTLYINNIMSTCTDCQYHLYADDTILYCVADSAEFAVKKLQLAFNSLQNSLVELKLVLNTGKTKFILFSRATIIDSDELIIKSISDSKIERVLEYKYLGIWLDSKLSFNYHITDLVSKLRQKIGFFYSKKSYFPSSCKKEITISIHFRNTHCSFGS